MRYGRGGSDVTRREFRRRSSNGGYVKMLDVSAKRVAPNEVHRSFNRKSLATHGDRGCRPDGQPATGRRPVLDARQRHGTNSTRSGEHHSLAVRPNLPGSRNGEQVLDR